MVRRVNAARYLTLAMAVLGVLITCVSIGAIAAVGMLQVNNGVQSGIGLVFSLAFTGFAFFVLLNSKNAKEFTG